ncbi:MULTISPECIES: hypothetical protein [unclassified Flavihumibacter]|uniref:hypothetical protein n=1 Tax=unclassified Flavihumibacter TaxID=2621068 RepID=UPI000B1DF0A4|nr:hypothetical protein [Flavihumibacter sp. ZG627]MCG7856446.1 hypothetical protein [Flavihumibacter sediminis]
MSLLNNNNKNKDKKKNNPQPAKPGFGSGVKGKSSTKAATRNTKLTGGTQRGS